MERKKVVLIINGSGGCGKDTMAEIMSKYVEVKKISSIDFVKKLLEPYTVDYIRNNGKDEKYRQLLSAVKKAFIEFNDLPKTIMNNEIIEFLVSSEEQILLIDIREPEEIEKMIVSIPQDFNVKTILVVNDNVTTITSNKSDESVFDYAPYDYIIDNSQTLEVLEESVVSLLNALGFEVEIDE